MCIPSTPTANCPTRHLTEIRWLMKAHSWHDLRDTASQFSFAAEEEGKKRRSLTSAKDPENECNESGTVCSSPPSVPLSLLEQRRHFIYEFDHVRPFCCSAPGIRRNRESYYMLHRAWLLASTRTWCKFCTLDIDVISIQWKKKSTEFGLIYANKNRRERLAVRK